MYGVATCDGTVNELPYFILIVVDGCIQLLGRDPVKPTNPVLDLEVLLLILVTLTEYHGVDSYHHILLYVV